MTEKALEESGDDLSAWLDDQKVSSFHWRIVALCGLVALVDGFDTQAIAYVAPQLIDDLEFSRAEMGRVFGAGLAGLMLGALTLSSVADRIGRRTVIILACFVFGGFALATAAVNSLEALIALRFLTGFGLGGAMPAINTMTAEFMPARVRARMLTLMFVGFPLGAVSGGIVTAQIIVDYGWRPVFLIGGTAPIVLGLFLLRYLPESPKFLYSTSRGKPAEEAAIRVRRVLAMISKGGELPLLKRAVESGAEEQAASPAHLFQSGRAPVTLLVWAVALINLMLLYSLQSWLPTVLEDAGMPLERAILGTTMLNLGGILGGFAISHLMDRQAPWSALIWANLIGAGALFFLGYSDAMGLQVFGVVFLVGCCVVGAQFGLNAICIQLYPTQIRSTGLGWMLGVGRLGAVFGPPLVGIALGQSMPQEELFLFATVAALLAAAVLFALRSFSERS